MVELRVDVVAGGGCGDDGDGVVVGTCDCIAREASGKFKTRADIDVQLSTQ